MQISGLRDTKFLTQPGTMRSQGMQDQRLIFVYPVLSYANLELPLLNTLRDFFSVNMISQIKERNMFNITVDAMKNVGLIGSGANAINPAQLVRKSLWNSESPTISSSPIDSWTNSEYRSLYQEKIKEFFFYIQNQISHDPRYVKLRPALSQITAENLLQIPLVIGTKHYTIDPIIMFYVLLISSVFAIPMKSDANITAIFNIIEKIPPENFINLIFDQQYRENLLTQIGLTRQDDPTFVRDPGLSFSQLRTSRSRAPILRTRVVGNLVYSLGRQEEQKFLGLLTSEMQKARIFFNLSLNLSRWTIESNGIETRNGLSLNNVSISTPIASKYYSSSINSFSSYLRSVIIPIFHSMEIIFGPTPPEISVSMKIESFLKDIFIGLEEDFQQLASSIIQYVRNQNTVNVATIQKNIKSVIDICEENAKMTEDIRKTFSDLDKVSTLHSVFDSSSKITDFIDEVLLTARVLSSHEKVIDEWFNLMTVVNAEGDRQNVQINNLLRSIEQYIRFTLNRLLYNSYPDNRAGNDSWIDLNNNVDIYQRYDTFAYTFNPPKTPITRVGADPNNLQYADYMRNIFSGQIERGLPTPQESIQTRNHLISFVKKLEHAIGDIIIFLLKWNFFSYICDYIKEVDIDIDIQSRDALEFPNYCLIMPIEIFSGLHNILSMQHFRDIVQDVGGVVDNIQELNFAKHPIDIGKIIEYVTNRLNIPNVIVVDKKSKKVFYKLMYMQKAVNLSISSLEQYVSHQKEILILH